jgi:hypothetical protein
MLLDGSAPTTFIPKAGHQVLAVDLQNLAPGTSGAAKAGAMMTEHTTAGKMSLAELAGGTKCEPSAILRLTAEHSPGGAYPANVAAYINGVFRGTIAATDPMPAGLHLYLP